MSSCYVLFRIASKVLVVLLLFVHSMMMWLLLAIFFIYEVKPGRVCLLLLLV
jgi:hypothetical protein